MSVIDDVIMIGASEDEMVWINRALYETDTGRRQQLEPLDVSAAGGTKFFTENIHAAAFNHFGAYHLPEILDDLIEKGKVRKHSGIQVFAKCEFDEDYRFKEIWPSREVPA